MRAQTARVRHLAAHQIRYAPVRVDGRDHPDQSDAGTPAGRERQ
ncbi:hypothetical protein [Nocardiopsis lambiniae]|uniref:Uncharacterized protein n=1 Tax=Nocardiopsis lambiniae TaxID=3075539 RepID=A0ABU2MB23_9ACTN|nr:hypothetical protein [Nocardiopsis sp. DSM 44743]MDT0329879.1 hypothetical protein [Nocardiopsis sp. DSM 44743]